MHAPRTWNTSTFKWLSIYAAIFALSVIVLIGFIAWSFTARMEAEGDSLLHWQLYYFESIPDQDLHAAIRRRLEQERMHVSYFGVFSPDGSHLAGDILSAPSELKPDSTGYWLDHTLVIKGEIEPPVVRAIAARRADGSELVIARDQTAVLQIRKTIIRALIAGGVFFLIFSFAAGILLSVRQLRRVRDIRRVTLRIAEGDLNQRLPTGGHDELDMLTHLVNHMLDEIERLMTEVKGACDGIAHDLRTPLGHIRTLLTSLSERTESLDDQTLQQTVQKARIETDLLLDRFRGMLRISEIEGLKRRAGFASISMSKLVHELVDLYEPLAEERFIRWTVEIEEVPDIVGDRALLFEALSNLLDNAIKFAPKHGEVRVELTRREQGSQVAIYDNGPGIPLSDRDAVMARFYRAEQTRHLAGSGLGLSIVSAVVRLHDFELKVGSSCALTNGGTAMKVECWPHILD